MSTIDSFGRNISPRMPDRGIRRRGAVSGHPFPKEDLDAYLVELINRSASEVGVNTRHDFEDFTTIPGAVVPMATNYGGVGPLFVWVTAAGAVKRLWLSRTASNGATGVTDCYRVQSVPNGSKSAYIFWVTDTGSANIVRFSTDWGATLTAASSRDWAEVYYHQATEIFLRIPKTSGTIQGYSSLANLTSNTPFQTAAGVNFTETDHFVDVESSVAYAARWVSSTLVNLYVVSGTSVVTQPMQPLTGSGYTFLNMNPIGLNGQIVMKMNGPNFNAYYGIHQPALPVRVVQPDRFTPSLSSIPFKVGNLLFDVDISGFGLWYTRDLVNWFFHSKASDSDELRSAVGSRLFTSSAIASNLYFSGPAI